jgi:hypothetical protein
MDDQPGRLVDDQQVLVLVGDAQVKLFGLERRLFPRRRVDLELLATRQAVTLSSRLTVDSNGTCTDQTLGGRARADLGQRCEVAVEPLARRLDRNLLLARGYRFSCRPGAISVPSSTATPTTMNVSARLNAGQ